MNGCRIGAADGSYQKELLEKWLDSNQIQAEVVICKGYDEMIEKLDADELDALVIPALSVNSDFIAIANIGASGLLLRCIKIQTGSVKGIKFCPRRNRQYRNGLQHQAVCPL